MWKIGVPVEECVFHELASLREAVKNEKLVVVEVDEGEHWFLIVEGYIIESWYGKYGPRVFECNDAFVREYENNELAYYIPNKHLF